MRKRFQIALAVLLVVVAGVIAWHGLRVREPVYDGKSLTFWLYEANTGNGPRAKKAEEVLYEAGTNAIPTLLRMLRKRDSAVVLKLVALGRKQHLVKITYVDADVRTFVATRPFCALGAEAKGAVPELIRIFDQNISEVSQADIAEILGSIGPGAKEAIPSLLQAAANTNRMVRECAIDGLSRIHSEPESVVPLLTEMLVRP